MYVLIPYILAFKADAAQFTFPVLPGENSDEEEPLDAGAIEEDADIFADNDDHEEDDSHQLPNLHPNDPANFFKLSKALQILLARELSTADVEEADVLLREYCIELSQVRLSYLC